MKLRFTNILLLLTFLIITGCSSNETDEQPKEEVSGTFEFSDAGIHNFSINASNITATITVIGAGGGGAGGVDYSSGNSSTGGGGGGGAGEVIILSNENLQGNATYTVKVGDAGNGGSLSQSGSNGQSSEILLEDTAIYVAMPGNGGLSNSINTETGGLRGTGFPAGNSGSNGESTGLFSFNATPGFGGLGGDNTSIFGFGGNGGIGTRLVTLSPISAENGNNGGNGYVKIEWTGLR